MYQSYFMESFISELNKAIKMITSILKDRDISFCIIGGAARFKYKVSKMTEDVDILIDKKDRDKLKSIPIGHMKDLSNGGAKVFNLHDPKTKVEFIYSDEISGDGVKGIRYPVPEKISKSIDGIPYITLKALIQFKLSAGIYGNRLKDFSDIVDLIQANHLKRNYALKFRNDLKEKYEELWDSIKNIKDM